ncbi:hypothetical protein F383_33055 [Gossypium arboreum]|uniref:Uncharacterized protein n=1 Tax=Gossypium arboreum TaxID=29729 RepID=A0A0B0N249_GOSAR|nr:hypothetical protein F383_33055 [Gossypium arboreum]
MSTRPVTRHVS